MLNRKPRARPRAGTTGAGRGRLGAASALCGMLLLSAAAAGLRAQDGVGIRVLNDTPDTLLVTLTDLDAQPPQRVVSGETINGNASISLSIDADGSGRGHLSWSAVTADPDMRRCGHGEQPGVRPGQTIHVSANQRCPAT